MSDNQTSAAALPAGHVAIIIPARFASNRFPGKPLQPIKGPDGSERPLIAWSIAAGQAVRNAASLHVATDDARIAQAAEDFGAATLMTPESCANGTERVAACAEQLPDADLFVNLQGDALLTPPHFVEALIAHMADHPEALVGTVAIRCTGPTYQHLADDARHGRVGGTTAVLDEFGNALYFSKRILPFIADDKGPDDKTPVFLHLGLYAYRREALAAFAQAGPCMLELTEGLEQLRFLAHGVKVSVLVMPELDHPLVEVNNPTDVALVEGILRQREQS